LIHLNRSTSTSTSHGSAPVLLACCSSQPAWLSRPRRLNSPVSGSRNRGLLGGLGQPAGPDSLSALVQGLADALLQAVAIFIWFCCDDHVRPPTAASPISAQI